MEIYTKTVVSLNKYKGVQCSSLSDSEYVFKVEWSGQLSPYNDGSYDITLYHNEQKEDLELNDWTFASVNHGLYHVPGRQSWVSLELECEDPKSNFCKVKYYIRNTDNFFTEGPALFFNVAMIVCLFKDYNEMREVLSLFDKDFIPVNLSMDIFDKAKKIKMFSEVIKRNTKTDIPTHFIVNAKRYYNLLKTKFQEDVTKEQLIVALFPDL